MENYNSLRLPAEWEKQSFVQVTFPHAATDWADILPEVLPCFAAIARAIARFEPVLVVTPEPEAVRNLLADLPAQQCRIARVDTNDTWARDHGGITVFDNETPVILDFVFNGWGLKFAADKDNLITGNLKNAGILHSPVRPGGMVLEGGGIESDGQGTLLTTSECLLSPNRNPHLDREATEEKLKVLFGLKRVLWLENGYLAGDDTDSHIDTLARFCDPETIAYVACPDPSDEHYESLRAMESELQAFRTLSGRAYRLVKLPWPDACYDAAGQRLPATYANFLIVNGAVLVPLYRVKQDEEAMRIFRELFPGREVVGIDCRPLIEQHGSLHCVTMQYYEPINNPHP